MITDKDCGPGKVLVNGMCVSATPEEKLDARSPKQAGESDIQYYRQYLQDLPAYDAPGQGDYTGMGTSAFHPNYGVPGRSQSARVLSTPLQTGSSGLNLTGVPGYAGGRSGGIDGYAGGRSGYDAADVASDYRVRETPKRMDAPFSMGDPYSQGGSLWNVGRMLENRVDPYGGIDPTLLYDLRRNAAGGADLPPGYTAGLGRTTPSEGYISVPDLLKAGGFSEGGGIPSTGIPAGAPAGGGGLFNLGGLFGGGAAGGGGLFGGIGAGVPSKGAPSRGVPSKGGKGAGGAKKGGSGLVGGISKGAGTAP
jgi:hypothetical protein